MKKILSTIGLGIALMTGIATSQVSAKTFYITSSPSSPYESNLGPDTWKYTLSVSEDLKAGDKITLITTAPINGIGSTNANWYPVYVNSHTAQWILLNDIEINMPYDFNGFFITSSYPNGNAKWSFNGVINPDSTDGPVPEPATVMLLGIGGLVAGARKLYESRKDAVMA